MTSVSYYYIIVSYNDIRVSYYYIIVSYYDIIECPTITSWRDIVTKMCDFLVFVFVYNKCLSSAP